LRALPLTSRWGVTLLAGLVLLGAGSCVPRPVIVTPGDLSAVDGETLEVEIDFGADLAPDARVALRVLAGIDATVPSIRDLSDRLSLAGDRATAELVASEVLRPGRNALFVSLDGDGDGTAERSASSTFSWEPDLDATTAGRCDVLDPADCLYPFPSDHFTEADPATDTGRRVRLVRESMPDNVQGVRVDPTEWNRNDGFSPGPLIQTLVPGLDIARTGAPGITDPARSLDADSPVVLIDAETGERQMLWAELNVNAPDPPEPGQNQEPELLIRPARNLENGRRYIVALRGLLDAAGEPIPASRGFRIYRDRIPTFRPALEERRPRMERIFADLDRAGVARGDLFLAWDFTVISTRNVSERLLAMRDDAFAWLGDAAPAFSIDEVEPRVDGRFGDYLRVRGEVEVPLYLTNGGEPGGVAAATRVRCEDADGSERVCTGDELPVRGGSFSAGFTCTVPATESPGEPVKAARASLYGHGLFGGSGETAASHVRAMAFEHDFVFCGGDWIGMAGEDVLPTTGAILADFSRFPTLADRLHQAMLNFLFLGRLMIHPEGLVSHAAFQGTDGSGAPDPTQPRIDVGGGLFYDGNSQGGIAGGALAAVAQDFTRAVLGVPAMNYSMLLRRSTDFDPFRIFLAYEPGIEESLVLALAQMLWDRVDPNGHANHITRDPYPQTPVKKILLHVAFSDFQVTNWAAEVEARTLGAPAHTPLLDPANPPARSHPGVDPLVGIGAIPSYPWDGSAYVLWDSGNLAPPTENRPSRPLDDASENPGFSACALRFGQDPHECPRRQPSARLQKSEFLRPNGAVIDVCGGEACKAPEG